MDWKLLNDRFELYTPQLYRSWYNYLSNPDYGIKISHLGDGYATTLVEPRICVTHYDFYAPTKGRFIYIKDNSTLWSPSYYPARTELDTYCCAHAPGYTSFSSSKNNIKTTHKLFLPEKGKYEINYIEIENTGNTDKEIECTFLAEMLLYDTFAVDPVYYSWFTNTEYKDGILYFYKLHGDATKGFITSIPAPDNYEASLKKLQGNGDMILPEAVAKSSYSNSPAGGDPYIGCYNYKVSLKPGETKKITVFLGIGTEEIDEIKKQFPTIDAVEKAFKENKDTWLQKTSQHDIPIEGTIGNYLNTFFPYQIYQQSEGLVRSTFRGLRDVAQDSAGLSYFDLPGSREIIKQMCKHQHDDGRFLRQWNTSGGYHDQRDFRDLPFWVPFSLFYYIQNSNDISILDEKIPFLEDDKAPETILEHTILGLKYALQFTKDDLVKIGIGDWNDALSGMGEEGGSVWLNMFAYYSLNLFESLTNEHSLKIDLDIKALKERLYKGTMAQWNGKWFNRGITDKGNVVGGPERIFLLPQAWFIISGMWKRDEEKGMKALNNMLARLKSSEGMQLCSPGFTELDPDVGNLSALAPGLAENFAVYNHASAFAIYALFKAGKNDDAVEYLKKLVPMYKDYKKTNSEPFVMVNYYNGGYYPEKLGDGGIPWLTSSISWLALILFEQIIPGNIKLED